MKLTGNTVLITGGSSGIGFALARQFLRRDNHVIVCGRSEHSLLKARADESNLVTRVCDIADAKSRQAMIEWLNTTHPELNVVINNAGVQHRRDFKQSGALENLEQEVAINLTAPIHLIGEVLPLLRRQPEALIVNVSSGLAFAPMADVPVYCAAKAAIHSFTLSLRHQLRATGVRVVEMVPPIVDTGLGGAARSEGTSSQRMMSAEEFATEALAQLEDDSDEVLVGVAVYTRKLGESLFERMNGR